jgi:hypothetical protein
VSTPNDDLPLNNRTGNLYAPLFADRIAALGKSSGKPPPPNRPSGGGTNWPVGLFVIVLFTVFRGCASLSTSNSRSTYEFKQPDTRELMKQLEQNRQRLGQWDEPPNGGLPPIRNEEFKNNPIDGDARRRNAEDEVRQLKERLDRLQGQQAAPPGAADKPDRGP